MTISKPSQNAVTPKPLSLVFPRMRGNAPPMWLWVFAILALGCFTSLVFYLDYHQKKGKSPGLNDVLPALGSAKDKDKTAEAKSNGNSGGKKLPDDGSGFDFYQLLPDLESVISDKEAAAIKPRQDGATAQPSPANTGNTPASTRSPVVEHAGLFLQTGAFKDYHAADRMKANLALLGLEASIQTVSVGNSGTWHRVRLGPYGTITAMRQAQNRLKAGNIQSIMVKTKRP